MQFKPKSLGRFGLLAILCIGAALAVLAPAASAAEVECEAITGSGSSLQNLAQTIAWAPNWEKTGFSEEHENAAKAKERCKATEKVTYTKTGSGTALEEWGATTGELQKTKSGKEKEIDGFIGTDVAPEGHKVESEDEAELPAEGTQMFNMDEAGAKTKKTERNKVVAIPVAQSAISVIVSLPVSCEPKEKEAVAAQFPNKRLQALWFEHTTTTLTDAQLLENLKLTGSGCGGAKSLKLESRSKGSGTTAGFKRYLNKLNSTNWKSFTETAEKAESPTEWPAGTGQETTNNTSGEALAEHVYTTPGTVGYADLADARAEKFTTKPVKHENKAKEVYYSFIVRLNDSGEADSASYVSPEGDTESATASNCEKATYPEPKKVAPNVDWSHASQGNATGGATGVYPLCTLTFDVGWNKYSFIPQGNKETGYVSDANTRNTVFSYLSWIAGAGQKEAKLTEEHYAPLAKAVRELSAAGVKSLED